MKQYSDVKIERSASGKEQLPVGGYVCQILSARVEENDWGSTLVMAVDVVEGEYAGIFKRDYDNNTSDNKKWRGTFRLRLPKDDGTEQDGWKKRALGNTIWALEQSNPGFQFRWDERELKGKKIGLIYRNKEWEYNGKTGWTTEAGAAESIDNIRNGKFRLLKDRTLANRTTQAVTESVESEEELPF
jgi:hypothetical protein